jgi:hypothetical protein
VMRWIGLASDDVDDTFFDSVHAVSIESEFRSSGESEETRRSGGGGRRFCNDGSAGDWQNQRGVPISRPPPRDGVCELGARQRPQACREPAWPKLAGGERRLATEVRLRSRRELRRDSLRSPGLACGWQA